MQRMYWLVLILLMAGCKHRVYYFPPLTGFEGKTMPNVRFLLPDSLTYFTTQRIPEGKSTVIFYFSPDCPLCRAQMTEMTKNIGQLKDTKLLVLTFARFNAFKSFYEEFKVRQYPNITAGQDYTDSIGHYFKLKGVPFTAVYNGQKKLSRAFTGRTSVAQIKAAAEE